MFVESHGMPFPCGAMVVPSCLFDPPLLLTSAFMSHVFGCRVSVRVEPRRSFTFVPLGPSPIPQIQAPFDPSLLLLLVFVFLFPLVGLLREFQ